MTSDPSFDHLVTLTDRYGTFEHADHDVARREHGYCVDDVARVLVVTAREPRPSPVVSDLARRSLRFVADAQGGTGRTRNRRTAAGRWRGRHGVEDCWGRSVWAFGVAAAQGGGHLAEAAASGFRLGAHQRSPWPRAMAFAALGAAAVIEVDPREPQARSLLRDAASVIDGLGTPEADRRWSWPEARLTYANAVLPEALLAAGHALDDPGLVDRGLELLGWLLGRETREGHLSVTPAGGAGPDDTGPRFDQQAIEVATMADACTRAALLTGDAVWIEAVRMADAWFDGDNDAGLVMWDPATGGGFDGLEPASVNRNQGAESTLALISTRQRARQLAAVAS